ncbi:MAG: universal stress protein [Armatimonadetes bacterium]|nr:universal stress protein [Armatimonadota bacterium]MDW8029690.1 universal stress protein [Armatimonadota bacterium]
MLKRLIWTTDFSETSQAALDWALALAELTKSEMVLLHIAEAEEAINLQLAEEHRRRLENIAEELSQKGLKVSTLIRPGKASQVIVQTAQETEADLVVMGAHGHTSFREKLLGSTTEQVLQVSSVPVLFVREKCEPKFRHFLVPSDLSDAALLALDYAVNLATFTNAKVTLLHVVAPYEGSPEAWEELKRETKEELKRWSNKVVEPSDVPAIETKVIRYHHPGAGITEFARENHVDLIIIPTHGHSALGRLIFGSVAAHVIYYAPCPVISGKANVFSKG